ncbi:MAG: M20/M25/M40 family metallo-hydrolase [Gemmatimonadaceae bacterium]
MALTSMPRSLVSVVAAVLVGGSLAWPLRAQNHALPVRSPGRSLEAVAAWIAFHAPPGHEQRATDAILAASPGWTRDAMGNLILHRGTGRPRRVVACALDRAGYVVSQITDDGFIRLHGMGASRRSPLWDQFHEGQRIEVLTRGGSVRGVVGVRSTHLARGSTAGETPATIDELWVDVGARSRSEVTSLGVALLDPVVRDWPGTVFGRFVAGPGSSSRAGCVAVASASRVGPTTGETIFIISTQSAFRYTGLAAALARLDSVDSLTIVDPMLLRDSGVVPQTVLSQRMAAGMDWPSGFDAGVTTILGAVPRFGGTLIETLSDSAIERLALAVEAAAGVRRSTDRVALPVLSPLVSSTAPRQDSVESAAVLLATLANVYGVSGHEAAVREALRSRLPAWAASLATVDTAGNLVLALGPDSDTIVFVAHMDETGLEVTSISQDGVVELRARGGFFRSLYEGQPALIHLDEMTSSALSGVFLVRDSITARQPLTLRAWFGMDSAELVAHGAKTGMAVTSPKTATRLAGTRFTARSIDDRTGSAALLLAVRRIDPARLKRKVIFLWATREEIGLEGARAAASQFGRSVRRVYAVDTFVSSDSPLESQRFAHAPIGNGAVLRALDNSSITPAAEAQRVATVARRHGIPIQIGTTNGGNDGSAFTRYGAVDIPLSWPARYSHSPVELIDLRDLVALSRLVAALANEMSR